MRPLLAAVLLVVAAPAAADEVAPAPELEVVQQAKAHFRRGAELYRQARYREAIAEFDAAYRLRPHGVVQYNLAQCHEKLGDVAAALGAYHAYLREVPHAEDRADVEAAVANLSARLGATGVQELFVQTDPPGADVTVDGAARGRTPFALALPLGPHQLEVAKPGFTVVRHEALLAPDRALEVELLLAREPPPAPSPAPSVAAAAEAAEAAAARPLSGAAVVPPAEVTASAGPSRRWTWVAAGVAGAALAAGVAYGLAARSASAELRSSAHDGATAQQLADSASSRSRNANALFAVAAAAGATGVTLFFWEGRF